MSWLQPTPENEQDIQQLRDEQPELYAYAQVLALALRIDSRLLRNLRLRFLPKSSVELETELWFSSLIHTRNVQAATMYSGIARALCDSLMKDENSERFASAKTEIGKLTHHWPETDRIEQEMRWAILENDEQTLKNNVQRILKALTLADGDVEKRELARWVKGTLPILKTTTQADTEQQWLSLYVAASLGLVGKWGTEDAGLQPLPPELVNALPKRSPQRVRLQIRSGRLEILNPQEKPIDSIEISMCLPMPAKITINDDQESFFDSLYFGKTIKIPMNTNKVSLETITGESYLIYVTQKKSTQKTISNFEIALQRIEECRRTRSPVLDISQLDIEAMPEQIFELTWLKKLNVSGSKNKHGRIKKIPLEIRQLTALKEFNFSLNQINDLSPLSDLSQLQSLTCNFNQISDLMPLRDLTQLQSLTCNFNQISDLMPLRDLTQLQTLNCKSNQINDLSALRGLLALQTLDCNSNQISNLTPLRDLPQLQTLNCNANQISDLSALNGLLALQTLDCNSNQISNLTSLRDLPRLQTLNCNANQISDLSALNGLLALQTLDCNSNQINNLMPLRDLPRLQTLDCNSNQISDLSALNGLLALQTLDCNSNQISNLTPLRDLPRLQTLDCNSNQISDLSALSDLLTLQTLACNSNQISDLTPLRDLPRLQTLGCNSNQISDLSALRGLLALQTLDCSSNQINNLTPIRDLPQLQTLDCSSNQINDLSPIYNFVMSGQLQKLRLYGNPVLEIPSGIFGSDWYDDCTENLKNYWYDSAKGKETKRQLKVQLVGNAGVGKTTLAYALEHKRAPREPFKSTHGISIRDILQPLDGEEEPVTLQLWDFGGQEIYHATHRLFLSDNCLYLLLWTEETEEHPDETRHPVSYWLESIHDLGKNSPVILVKNQIDRSDRLPTLHPELIEDLPGVNQIRHAVKISAMQYRGMPILRGAIESVLEELKYRVCLELPTSWLEVQRALTQLHDQKSIPFTHFKQLCIKAGIDHSEWFVSYLHKTGELFYREGTFQDQVILDQNWIIEAIYRVFDPNQPHRRRIERMGGRFSGEDASLFWANEEAKEQEVYVDFMRNCGICYELQKEKSRQAKPFTEREFLIPALLPLTSKAKTAWGNPRPNDWQLDIEYPFLHRSIIDRIILRIVETYESEPWRTGIFCNTDEGQLLLECKYTNKQHSTQGRLHFQLRGNQLERLVYALRKLVSEISPHRRYTEYLGKAGSERIQLPEFKDEEIKHKSRLYETKSVDNPIKLFISYSHADEAHKERLEKHLKAISRTFPLTAWSDRHLFAGEAVDEQIFQQLNTADIVLLLVSPDFINSDYCFTKEMERALERYQDEGNVVIPVIIRQTASWHNHKIGQIVALPKDGKPLVKWDDADEFWGSVEDGIREHIKKILAISNKHLEKNHKKLIQQIALKEDQEVISNLNTKKQVGKTIKLFISYSHVDEAHKNELELCLKNIKRRLPLEYWHDRQMFAGKLVDDQILSHLETADIVVLLVSRNFLTSDYCFSIEIEKALKRYEQNHNIVIPVIIHSSEDWRELEIGKTTTLPTNGKPLSKWDDKDEFWANVQQGISSQVQQLLNSTTN